MATFRKRPVEVEAFQMTQARRWDNREWPPWLNEAWQRAEGGLWIDKGGLWIDADDPARERLVLGTWEGVFRITWDDWIIRGIQGELYPCKPDIFVATYEAVTSPAGAPPGVCLLPLGHHGPCNVRPV